MSEQERERVLQTVRKGITRLFERDGLRPDSVAIEGGGQSVRLKTQNRDRYRAARYQIEEQPVISAFVDSIKDGDLVWDVGAQAGLFAIHAAKKTPNVVAWEPRPANVSQLEENLRLNSAENRVDVRQVALGAESAQMELATANGEERLVGEGGDVVVNVEPGDQHAPPDVLKIDVEGAEAEVLRGMGESLKRVRVVFVEVHERELREFFDSNPEEVRALLESHGLECTQIHSRGRIIYFRGER